MPRLAHSSQSSAIVELGVIGKIAITSLSRNATEAAASLPSMVASFLFVRCAAWVTNHLAFPRV